MKISVVLIAVLFLFSSVAHAQSVGDSTRISNGPQVIVYKTKKNYNKYVPVVLSEDNKTIVSYPAPQDIFIHGKLAYPTKLVKGYLLDNRGINIHTAFLDLTYSEYSKLQDVDPVALLSHIKAKNPFVFFYRCGKRKSYSNIVTELNAKILAGKLKECECLIKP